MTALETPDDPTVPIEPVDDGTGGPVPLPAPYPPPLEPVSPTPPQDEP